MVRGAARGLGPRVVLEFISEAKEIGCVRVKERCAGAETSTPHSDWSVTASRRILVHLS
jgi:hypothetical protein